MELDKILMVDHLQNVTSFFLSVQEQISLEFSICNYHS